MNLPRRRQTPRTLVGKLFRAWPKIRLAIRITRLIYRVRSTARVALFTLAAVAIARLLTRRRRSEPEPVSSYAPSPVPTSAPQPAQPVAAEEPTETERKLHAEK